MAKIVDFKDELQKKLARLTEEEARLLKERDFLLKYLFQKDKMSKTLPPIYKKEEETWHIIEPQQRIKKILSKK